MKVFYSPYTLHPLKRANRLSSMDPKKGVLLKGELGRKISFADYFPHLALGDRSPDQFLSEFKYQNEEYDQKVFDLLLRDSAFQKLVPKSFRNHQLWTGSEPLLAPIVKYKMLHHQDRNFLVLLQNGLRLRLDGNALFDRSEYEIFLKEIPEKYHSLIDYIEDPLKEKNWENLKIPSARDFIEGTHFQYYIYKPNVEFTPQFEAQTIFSAYLGSNLGRWHTYCELMQTGDLSLTHGIISEGFYEEEKSFLEGSYKNGFIAEPNLVKKLYQEVYDSDWKLLCSL